jgi:pimeloyl-ACP methyl ester carboxylesterase
MGTFVLVHGAMHGGWCWRDVRRRLWAQGHDTFTPSLSGQGEHAGWLSPEIGVATHVDEVGALCEMEDLSQVTLALHSYAGTLAGPLAERLQGRLSAVVLLGAIVVRPGECLLDMEPPETAQRYRELAAAAGGWRIPAGDAFMDQWAVPGDLRPFVGPRLRDFPLRCTTDPVEFDPGPLSRLPVTYVWHTAPPLGNLTASRAAAEAAGWPVRELATGHDLMLTAPQATADLLLELAG